MSRPGRRRSQASCRPNRGGTTPPLFLMNHWVESYPPRPRDADVVNKLSFLLTRAHECERARDRVVNMLAVDFAERGNLLAAATSLNGLKSGPAAPRFRPLRHYNGRTNFAPAERLAQAPG